MDVSLIISARFLSRRFARFSSCCALVMLMPQSSAISLNVHPRQCATATATSRSVDFSGIARIHRFFLALKVVISSMVFAFQNLPGPYCCPRRRVLLPVLRCVYPPYALITTPAKRPDQLRDSANCLHGSQEVVPMASSLARLVACLQISGGQRGGDQGIGAIAPNRLENPNGRKPANCAKRRPSSSNRRAQAIGIRSAAKQSP